jgi:hypothetical protein
MLAPLHGHNLVRLLYLDEAGTDFAAPFLSVSGVLVHGDFEWPEIDKRILSLIEKYIPEQDRLGFYFHATDIFHGAGYFDRRKPEWESRDKRWAILLDLARIIEELSLPVVAGTYRKSTFGDAEIQRGGKSFQRDMIQTMSVLDCLLWADRWLERYAGAELATVVHEDGTAAKKLIRQIVRIARSSDQMQAWNFPMETAKDLNLPLRRIIDTVHFAEKTDARPLQLADLCAFILGRAMKEHEVPVGVFEIIFKHLRWIVDLQGHAKDAEAALAALRPSGAQSS